MNVHMFQKASHVTCIQIQMSTDFNTTQQLTILSDKTGQLLDGSCFLCQLNKGGLLRN